MTTLINASPTNGLVQTADGSGVLKVQSNGVTTNALAWVNFNGTGTVAIRSSYNVSSITDNGAGTYTVNFTTAMSDANYAVLGTCNSNTGYNNDGIGFAVNVAMNLTTPIQYNTSGVRISIGVGNGAPSDAGSAYVNVVIFGN